MSYSYEYMQADGKEYVQFGNIRIPRWIDDRPIWIQVADSIHELLIRLVIGRRTVIMNAHILNGIILAELNNVIIRDNLFENGEARYENNPG